MTLPGNATLLEEMILNLLDNAIGYTPSSAAQPGVITACVLADPFGHVLVLQVEDAGPGIPESERELVFQPFYRALGTNVDGSGLGLPIVREIARQHDAEIRLEDARHPRQHPLCRGRSRGDCVCGSSFGSRIRRKRRPSSARRRLNQAGLWTLSCRRSRSIARATAGSRATRCECDHRAPKPVGSIPAIPPQRSRVSA